MTALEEILPRAVAITKKLKSHDNVRRKLTYEKFFETALAIAGCDEARIKALDALLAQTEGFEEAKGFLHRLERVMEQASWTSAINNGSKLVRAYGRETTLAEIVEVKATSAEFQALAVWRIYRRLGAAAFGPLQDLQKHDAKGAELRQQLQAIYREMRSALCGDDIEFSDKGLLPALRDAGLCRAWFRNYPAVSPAGDWPRLLVERRIKDRGRPRLDEAA